jgi:hypothetical protein
MGRSGGSNKKLASTLLGQKSVRFNHAHGEPVEKEEDVRPASFLDSYLNNDYDLPRAQKINGALVLVEGEKLVNYHSPTNKEYIGSVLINRDPSSGQTVYQGVCYWGPGGKGHSQVKVYYQGSSLDDARQSVRNQIAKKVRAGYSLPSSGSGFDHAGFLARLPKT